MQRATPTLPRVTQKQIRVYITGHALETFTRIVEGSPGLSEAQFAGLLVNAALLAVEEDGGKVKLPLRFEVVDR